MKHCKFQLLIFNTYLETDISIFSHYKCIGRQIWPCCKRIKGHPRIIIWTKVDFESQMRYSKIHPQSILGSGEEEI